MKMKQIVDSTMRKKVYFALGLFTHFVCVIAYLISIVHRCFVFVIIRLVHSNKYRLVKPGTETILAGETNGSPNVIYVLKCSGTPNLKKIVEKLDQIPKYETKLISGGQALKPYRPFEKLRYSVQLKYYCWCWKTDYEFRMENHVKLENVTANFDLKIQRKCENLLDKSFVMGEPWWDVSILQNTEDPKQYAVIWCVHHIYGDATIFTQMFRYCLADYPFPIKIEPLEWDRKHEAPTLMDTVQQYLKPVFLASIGSFGLGSIYGQCLSQNLIREVIFLVDNAFFQLLLS